MLAGGRSTGRKGRDRSGMLVCMVSVTISVPDTVYAWLAKKASSSNVSVQELIEDQVQKIPQGDPENPEFVAAMEAVFAKNQGLLKRLAQ